VELFYPPPYAFMTCTGRVSSSRGLKMRLRMSGAVLDSPICLHGVHRDSFTLLPLYLPLSRTRLLCISRCFIKKIWKAVPINRQYDDISRYCTLHYAIPNCGIDFVKAIDPTIKTSAVRSVSGGKSFSLILLLHVSARPLPYSVTTSKVQSGYPLNLYLKHYCTATYHLLHK
jgi:hypothetical protein